MSKHNDPDAGCTPWERRQRGALRDIDTICDVWPVALLELESIGFGSGRDYSDNGSRATSDSSSVESAALQLLARGSMAVAWVAELGDVVVDLTRRATHPSGAAWTPSNARLALRMAADDVARELPQDRPWTDSRGHVLPHLQGPLELLDRIDRLASQGANAWRTPRKGETVDGVVVGELRTNQAELCAHCGDPVVSGRDDNGQVLLKRDGRGRAFHAACWYTLQLVPIRAATRRTCSIDGCERPHHAKDLCQAHYARWISTGVLGGQVGVA